MEVTPEEERIIRKAFEVLGGVQSIDAIRDWVKLHGHEINNRKIGTILRGCSDLEKARDRHPNFPVFLKRIKRAHYELL